VNTHETIGDSTGVRQSSNRTFGLVFTAFFAIVALLPLWSGHPIRRWALAASAVFLATALLVPVVLAPFNALWTRLGGLLHKITNPVVLGLLFYTVFTPFGLVMRLLGRDGLRLKYDSEASTYWISRQPPGPPPNTMINQF
jgi:Saxitoxin biosynthesis operon protein SxtJ